jgi:hypothetical protein
MSLHRDRSAKPEDEAARAQIEGAVEEGRESADGRVLDALAEGLLERVTVAVDLKVLGGGGADGADVRDGLVGNGVAVRKVLCGGSTTTATTTAATIV